MNVPVIDPPATPRVIARGMAFALALSASNDPETWSASGLPPGLSIDPAAGTVSGTPTAAGLFTATFTSANAEGTSEPVQLVFSVQPAPPGGGSWGDVELDWDLVGGLVRVPGVDTPEGEPVLRLKRGDHFPLLFGIGKWGVLQEIDADASEVSLQVGIKEFEPERLATLTTGAPEKAGESPDQTRYRIWIGLTPAQWSSILDGYEDDEGTEVLALAEAQLVVGRHPEIYDETLEAGFTLLGGLGVSGPYGSPALEETFAFAGLGEYTSATPFRLTLALSVAGRASQSVSLLRTFSLIYDAQAGAWTVSELSGPGSVQGAEDGDRWRVTMAVDAVEGTSGGLDVDVTLTTTADATPLHIEAEIPYSSTLASPGGTPEEDIIEYRIASNFTLLDAGGNTIGSDQWHPDDYGGVDPSNPLQNFPAAWEAQTGMGDLIDAAVLSDDPNAEVYVIRFLLAPSSPVHGLRRLPDAAFVFPATTYPRSGGTVSGEEAEATLAARLLQLEAATPLPLSRTSRTFRIGVARDMVPDR